MLTDHLGTDLAKISNELGKLLLSLPEVTKKITDAHIEQNIGISKDFNNSSNSARPSRNRTSNRPRIADHFARNPKDNPPLLVTILAAFSISSAKFSASTTCGGSAATREFRFARTRNSWASCE